MSMAVVHEHTIRTSYTASGLQLACDGTFLTVPHGRTSIAVYSLQDITCKPIVLEGHHKAVTAQALSHRKQPTLLCSCSDDYVIIWNISKARAAVENDEKPRGMVIGTTLGRVQHCTFSVDDFLVALCIDREVVLLDTRQERIDTTLEGHNAFVNCAEFCPHYTSTLVTASDDRTFKIWDISSTTLLYQSTIISSSPFISLTMDPLNETFALGTADGQIRVYDLRDGNGFRCLHQLDVDKLLRKLRGAKDKEREVAEKEEGPRTISSRPTWQQDSCPQLSTDFEEEAEDSEAGCGVLGMFYTARPNQEQRNQTPLPFLLRRDNSLLGELLEDAPMMVIVSPGAVIQVNAKTLEPCTHHDFLEPILSSGVLEDTSKVVNLVGSATLAQNSTSLKLWCIVSNIFGNEINILNLSQPTEADQNELKIRLATQRLSQTVIQDTASSISADSDSVSDKELTVLSCTPVVAGSPLKAELNMKPKDSPVKKTGAKGKLTKGSSLSGDKPITFHSKVKSSGYTDKPRTTMFKPKTNFTPKSPASGRTTRSSSLSSAASGRTTRSSSLTGSLTGPWRKDSSSSSLDILTKKQYPLTGDAPTNMEVKIDVAERPTAITCVRFSEDGQNLACSLANTSCQVFKMPLSGKGWAFTGHDGSVTNVGWSHDNSWIITSSDDKSAYVWSMGLSDPVMTFNLANNNFRCDKEGGLKPSKENPLFSKSVKFAQFYYMDKFILLTHGNSFNLYKYHLDTSKSDIKRYLNNNRYKLVKSFETTQGQQITAFSAVNGFHSYIVMCASSNRSLDVFDMNVGQSVRTIPDVHSRTVHTICQNAGSSYVSHPSSSYDLFVTAAASDCIKLWDLRSNRCVRKYEGHSNRIYPCGVSISPCSRFIATGSEDRSAYIFDIRSGTYLHKITGHTDTVGHVAFHPLYPRLITASLDGKIRLFTNR